MSDEAKNDEEMDDNWEEVEQQQNGAAANGGDDIPLEEDDEHADEEWELMENGEWFHDDTASTTPKFDALYTPIAESEIQQLSDTEFREHIFLPVLREHKHSALLDLMGDGVEKKMKHAMYAFLVNKLK